jgi:hypothetical protein
MGLAAAAAMVFTTSPPTVAYACSPPGRGRYDVIDMFPDIEGRPTNACIVVGRIGEPGLGDMDAGGAVGEFAYVGPDGTEIVLLPGTMRCPERALDPLSVDGRIDVVGDSKIDVVGDRDPSPR